MRHYRVGSHGPVSVRIETCNFKVERSVTLSAWSDEPARAEVAANRARVRWSSEDPVSALMLPPGTFPTVGSYQSCELADALTATSGLRDLVVLDQDGVLVGVLSRWDLARRRAADRIVDCMSRDVLTIAPDATLGDAVAAMKTFRFGCLPVVDEDDVVVGLLTRAQLRALGVPIGLVGPDRCARCHVEETPLDEDELCPCCGSAIDWTSSIVSVGEPD